jgi:hypothetical protein
LLKNGGIKIQLCTNSHLINNLLKKYILFGTRCRNKNFESF